MSGSRVSPFRSHLPGVELLGIVLPVVVERSDPDGLAVLDVDDALAAAAEQAAQSQSFDHGLVRSRRRPARVLHRSSEPPSFRALSPITLFDVRITKTCPPVRRTLPTLRLEGSSREDHRDLQPDHPGDRGRAGLGAPGGAAGTGRVGRYGVDRHRAGLPVCDGTAEDRRSGACGTGALRGFQPR